MVTNDPAVTAQAHARWRASKLGSIAERVETELIDGSFDAVLAVTVRCFVPDAEVAVREMARVLVPGGRLVLGELGRFSVWAAERRVRGWFGASMWQRAQFWSGAQLEGLARNAGLCVADVRGSVFFPPSGLAARLVAPFEPLLTRLHAPGAAFLALAADKPRCHHHPRRSDLPRPQCDDARPARGRRRDAPVPARALREPLERPRVRRSGAQRGCACARPGRRRCACSAGAIVNEGGR